MSGWEVFRAGKRSAHALPALFCGRGLPRSRHPASSLPHQTRGQRHWLCRWGTMTLKTHKWFMSFGDIWSISLISLWTGLKVLRCCIHCEIVGTIKGEKRFKGAHWHCYRCRNGFNRRDEAIKHYKTHFRNPHTTFQIQVTQVKVDKPGLNLFSTLDKAFFDHVCTCAVLECELPTVLWRELRGSC